MPVLSTELRSKLEKTVAEARDVAEAGARIALESLAVHHYEPYFHMDDAQRKLRNRLRARARQLGDQQEPGGRLEIRHLIRECAYEHWHRMLFAQFLAANNLLIEPEMGIAITMAECEELAREAGEDPRAMAARFAQDSLPQIFREGDPVLELALPPETQQTLDRLLDSLPSEVFTADDSLGWTYQFWQSKRKDEVNASGNKIGADELPAVTQLFTEHYMVLFLYHNTIGAWHAGKALAANPSLAETAASEQELRDAVRLRSQGGYSFDYLRFVRSSPSPLTGEGRGEGEGAGPWRPAAGTFDGWPKTAKEITVLDPCCGSGHFLNEGFQLLTRLRMDEEGLDLKEAIEAVLTDNLHGLELDPRCTQIAAFNLALAAWKVAGKPIELPPLHIACSGLAVGATKGKWISLAGDDPRLRAGMERLYDLFEQAPELGSLIDPKALKSDLFVADFAQLQPLLEKALEHERDDDEKTERAVTAQGMAKAAELLSGEYTLAITNVPYLGRGQQSDVLKEFADNRFKEGRADLSTTFLQRTFFLLGREGTAALVTPQNWLFLGSYKRLRRRFLQKFTWNAVVQLGSNAFQKMNWWAATTALISISAWEPSSGSMFVGLGVGADKRIAAKASFLAGVDTSEIAAHDGFGNPEMLGPVMLDQSAQLRNPDCRIVIRESASVSLLEGLAQSYHGLTTGDASRMQFRYWELGKRMSEEWEYFRGSFDETLDYAGCENVLRWGSGAGAIDELPGARKDGQPAWGQLGVIVRQMRHLPASIYTGEPFDNNTAVIVPNDPGNLLSIWAFAEGAEFRRCVRMVDQKLSVTSATLVKIDFDPDYWQKVAAEKYPNGLPEPQSNDPTQWLFHGHPANSEPTTALQVVIGRLLGYRWPPELDPEMRLADEARGWVARCNELLGFSDEDGIVCIPSIRGEPPAAERVRTLLAAAFGADWTPEKERALIAETGSTATDLDAWLRNDFFEQHCKLFHHRPFIWHIWDGRKRDGFHALVNYHKLAEGDGGGRRTLENLTYSYLGDWITRQKDGVYRGVAGAEDRFAAALELRERLIAILEGEPPFDLFIRWKPLSAQPIDWEPDINDGVRLNVRSFMASDIPGGKKGAGVFRSKPNIKWGKDRGKEPISLRPRLNFPWFWSWDEQTQDFLGGDEFDGNRWNDLHYTNKAKQAAREAAKEGGR